MNVYGYIDTRTGNNDYHAQHYGIMSFTSNNRLGQVHFIHQSVPDQIHSAKPILSGMISTLQREDVLIVTDFSKLGSSTAEVLDVLLTLSQRGVWLYVVGSGYRLDDNVQAQVVAMACTLAIQVEQDLRVRPEPDPTPIQMQRDDTDLQTPARRTRKSKLDDRRSEIEELLSTGISLSAAALRLGVSRPTLTDWVDSRNLYAQNPPATT